MPQPYSGIFLTVEGIEGVGKSTAVKYIERYLSMRQKDVSVTREPGGTAIAERIRQILLTPTDEIILPETELLLLFAGRIQHIHHVILPALHQGKWVVCDRFVDASFAYQGGGRCMDLSHIKQLEAWLVKTLQPTLTLLLDAPPEIGLMRAMHRGSHDRIEQEKFDFFERVRAVYLKRASENPARFRVIDATEPLASVEAALENVLNALC